MLRDDVETTVVDGHAVYRLGDLSSAHRCPYCGLPFVPHDCRQKTCGAKKCQERRRDDNKRNSPTALRKSRIRSAEWARLHRNCRRRKPVLMGAPVCASAHMPGLGFVLHIEPRPRWPIQLRNTRAVHGMVTALLDMPHQRWPEWALLPVNLGCGWAIYVRDTGVAERLLEKRSVASLLYDHGVTVTFSSPWRSKYPRITRRGWRNLRIDAITPVVIRSMGGTVHRPFPTKTGIISALTNDFPARVGVELERATDLELELVSSDARTETTPMGGKLSHFKGWLGSVVVRTNAIGEFLLRCASAGPGLGGRTAFGFGRVVVSHVD